PVAGVASLSAVRTAHSRVPVPIRGRVRQGEQEKEHAMGDRLAGKVALITGGGGGIGAATAHLFHEEGAAVMLVDIDAAAVRTAAAAIDPSGQHIAALSADLAREAEAERAVNETVARFGHLDVLATIAAVRLYGPVTQATPASWEFIIGVNLLAVAYCCK